MLKDELTNEQESMLIGKDKQTTIGKADHDFLLPLDMAPLPFPHLGSDKWGGGQFQRRQFVIHYKNIS
jgi:hypothetical protein